MPEEHLEQLPQATARDESRGFINRLITNPIMPVAMGVGVPGAMQYFGIAPTLLTPESAPAWSALAGFISSFARDFVRMPLSVEPSHRMGDVFGRMLPRGIAYGLTCAGVSFAINVPSVNKLLIQTMDAGGAAFNQARDAVQEFAATHPIKWPEFFSLRPDATPTEGLTGGASGGEAPLVNEPWLDKFAWIPLTAGVSFAVWFMTNFHGRNVSPVRIPGRKH